MYSVSVTARTYICTVAQLELTVIQCHSWSWHMYSVTAKAYICTVSQPKLTSVQCHSQSLHLYSVSQSLHLYSVTAKAYICTVSQPKLTFVQCQPKLTSVQCHSQGLLLYSVTAGVGVDIRTMSQLSWHLYSLGSLRWERHGAFWLHQILEEQTQEEKLINY